MVKAASNICKSIYVSSAYTSNTGCKTITPPSLIYCVYNRYALSLQYHRVINIPVLWLKNIIQSVKKATSAVAECLPAFHFCHYEDVSGRDCEWKWHHCDEIFITGWTRSCLWQLLVQSVLKIASNDITISVYDLKKWTSSWEWSGLHLESDYMIRTFLMVVMSPWKHSNIFIEDICWWYYSNSVHGECQLLLSPWLLCPSRISGDVFPSQEVSLTWLIPYSSPSYTLQDRSHNLPRLDIPRIITQTLFK